MSCRSLAWPLKAGLLYLYRQDRGISQVLGFKINEQCLEIFVRDFAKGGVAASIPRSSWKLLEGQDAPAWRRQRVRKSLEKAGGQLPQFQRACVVAEVFRKE